MTGLTLATVDSYEALLRAATPGPWTVGREDFQDDKESGGDRNDDEDHTRPCRIVGPNGEDIVGEFMPWDCYNEEDDTAFIAAAPEIVARLLAFARDRLTTEAAALIDRPPWNYDDVLTENLRACLASILASVEQGDAERARSLDTIAQMRAELDRRALPVLRVTERQLRPFHPHAAGECEPTSAAEPCEGGAVNPTTHCPCCGHVWGTHAPPGCNAVMPQPWPHDCGCQVAAPNAPAPASAPTLHAIGCAEKRGVSCDCGATNAMLARLDHLRAAKQAPAAAPPASTPTAEERAAWRTDAQAIARFAVGDRVLRLLDALDSEEAEVRRLREALVTEYKARMATEDRLYRAHRDLRVAAERARTPATSTPSFAHDDFPQYADPPTLRTQITEPAEPSADAARCECGHEWDEHLGCCAFDAWTQDVCDCAKQPPAVALGAEAAFYAGRTLEAEADAVDWKLKAEAAVSEVAALRADRDRMIAVVTAWQQSGRVSYHLRDEVIAAARQPDATEARP